MLRRKNKLMRAAGRVEEAICPQWSSHPVPMSNTTASVRRQDRRQMHVGSSAAADWTSTDYSRRRWNNRGVVEQAQSLRHHLD